jgi:enoyl-CoA hydratase/carnithine racemase
VLSAADVGPQQSLRFFVSGEKVGAGGSRQLGLVGEVVDSAHLLDVALELAERIAVKPRAAVAHTKALL